MKILVTYASKHGSTAEIAQAVSRVLYQNRHIVDLVSVGQITNLASYDAVIIGSAIYSHRWLPDAAQFLKTRVDILAHKPVWLFSCGPTGEGDANTMFGGVQFEPDVHPYIQMIAPVDIVIFHGRLELAKLTLAELQIVKNYGGELGDFRQWHVIDAWANQIAQQLKEIEDNTASTV